MMIDKKFFVLVIYPSDSSFLEMDVGGICAGEYLIKQLDDYKDASVKVLYQADQLSFIEFLSPNYFNIGTCAISEIYQIGCLYQGLLIMDGRNWLPHCMLENIFLYIKRYGQAFRLYESSEKIPYSYRDAMTLAIYIPAKLISPSLFQKNLMNTEMGIEKILKADILSGFPEIKDEDLNQSQHSLLINSYIEIAEVERRIYFERALDAMKRGIYIRDPHAVYIRGDLSAGSGVTIDVNVIIEGSVVLGKNVRIGANTILKDCRIDDESIINPYSLIEQSSVGSDSFVGPYGRLRPGSIIGSNVQIGNYVEIKNSSIGDGSRINHHTFIGDAKLANQVTVGAGTITCNHNGIGINQTLIGQGVYIGSGCNLVAPLSIGNGAIIGAGSTITEDVPASKLVIARSRQATIVKQANTNQSRTKE